jgi:hypothetical protein
VEVGALPARDCGRGAAAHGATAVRRLGGLAWIHPQFWRGRAALQLPLLVHTIS